MNKQVLQKKFVDQFGENGEQLYSFFAPGRVCLIGEHIDYNGGNVLPCALSNGTYLALRKRKDQQLNFHSLNYNAPFQISIGDVKEKLGSEWWNYPLGVFHEFKKLFSLPHGFDMVYFGDLAIGAGLSSSASIEVVTALAINHVLTLSLSLRDLALLAQRAENNFIKVQCGIMDQYASALGKKNFALFLDCVKAEHEYIPVNTGEYEFIIANTNKQRKLNESAFNERHAECKRALLTMQRLLEVSALADATPAQFEEIENFFPDEITRKRARHVVHENERVKQACIALSNGDVNFLATLMNASHDSLRDLYDVSCFELNELVEAARSTDGCLGSRLSGAGFGGCTISLIRKDLKEDFCKKVSAQYNLKTGLTTEFYQVAISDGVREMN